MRLLFSVKNLGDFYCVCLCDRENVRECVCEIEKVCERESVYVRVCCPHAWAVCWDAWRSDSLNTDVPCKL